MHPIINDYIFTGDRLATILEKHYQKDQFLESVFFRLSQSSVVSEIDPKMYLEIDQAIISGHPDNGIYLLFISSVITHTATFKEFERARAIQSIGLSLSRDKLHPTIQAFFSLSRAVLKHYEGKSLESNQLLKETVSLVDKKNPRYRTILYNLAGLIAEEGRLNELDNEDLALIDNPLNDRHSMVCSVLKIVNSIFTGDFKKGFLQIEKDKELYKGEYAFLLENKNNSFKILSGNFDEKNYVEADYKLYAKVCYYSSLGDYDESLIYFHELKKTFWDTTNYLPLIKYFSLNFELFFRNKGSARLHFHEMAQKQNPHYLDDFFLARIQLLELNIDGAYESFSRLIENVKRYGAMNRLLFEIQFAKEMNTTDILMLMSGINDEDILKNLKNKREQLGISIKQELGINLIVGGSPIINQVKELVKIFAKLKEPVLITGETGTGKELVSRAIHDEGSYPKEPFLAINCGALTESLLQSELFGYEAGAFTGAQKERKGIFEAAGKGTVFLDEFGDISPQMQVSLLRVLESNEIRLIGGTSTRQIECKIVIATNIDLLQAVDEKKFREDLYFRLTKFDIKLPPLRHRKEDIPQLISCFLNENKTVNNPQKELSKELLEKLIEYHWPGNIRELKNEMERLKILHSDKEILNLEDFDFTRLQGSELPKREKTIVEKDNPPLKTVVKERILDQRVFNIIQRGSKVDQRLELIKDLFKKFKKLTRMQVIAILAVSPVTATKSLETLCEIGFIEKIKPTKSVKSFYFTLVE